MKKFNRPLDAFLYILGVIIIFLGLGSAIRELGWYIAFNYAKWIYPYAFAIVLIIVVWATSPLWKSMWRDYKENGSVFKKEFRD